MDCVEDGEFDGVVGGEGVGGAEFDVDEAGDYGWGDGVGGGDWVGVG